MADMSSSWRWRHITEPDDHRIPYWMIVGPGASGAAHGAALYLVRVRQSATREQWACRPVEAVHAEGVGWRGIDLPTTRDILDHLERAGVVRRHGDCWTATPLAVKAIEEAYATRHPLTD